MKITAGNAFAGELVRRPSVRGLWLGMLGVIALLGVLSYSELGVERSFAKLARHGGTVSAQSGVCSASLCYQPGLRFVPAHLVSAGKNLTPSDERELRNIFAKGFDDIVAHSKRSLGWMPTARARARTIATGLGVAWAILIGAIAVGRDFGLRMIPTLVPFVGSRRRLMKARLSGTLLTVSAGAVGIWLVMLVVDAVQRAVLGISTGPLLHDGFSLLRDLMWMLIVCGVFATLSASIAYATRSGIAALATPLGLLVADAVLTRRASIFRYILPGQAVAAVTHPQPGAFIKGVHWMHLSMGPLRCTPRFGCLEQPLPSLHGAVALAILAGWALVSVAVAVVIFTRRDISASPA